MIENMNVEFGRTSDIDSWMRLVKKVSWNFPGFRDRAEYRRTQNNSTEIHE